MTSEYEEEYPIVDVGESTPRTEPQYKCSRCGREWDSDEWEKDDEKSWSSRSGGVTYYNCPEEGCDGLAASYW